MVNLSQIAVRLVLIGCLAAVSCQGQAEIQRALELPYPEKKAETRARILAAGEAGAEKVVADIKTRSIETGLDFVRKDFLIDGVLDFEEPIALRAVRDLLDRKNTPTVIMLTVRRIASRRESKYLSEFEELLDDERVATTISSPIGDQPVTVRWEVIEALSAITGMSPSREGASEAEQAAAWQQWFDAARR